MIRVLSLCYCFAASAVFADVPAALENAFRGWVGDVGSTKAVMAIWHGDAPHAEVAIGMSAGTPVELASLSKAITALCAAQLIQSKAWTPATTSAEVLGYGAPGVSVAALLNHSSGIAPDQTQTLMPLWLDSDVDRSDQAARVALTRDAQLGSFGEYGYSNENYAILGAMIAAETQQPYAAYCAEAVLAPAGVTTARLSPRSGGMAAWGGWQMTATDYARFMHWAYGPDGIIGGAPAAWPEVAMGGGAFYGVGMVQRDFRAGRNYWHFGALCFPGRLNIGSYAVRWLQEWSVVVAYDRCLSWDDMVALDAALARAVFQ